MLAKIKNNTNKDILILDGSENGKCIPPGHEYKFLTYELNVDSIDFRNVFVELIQDYFDGKFTNEKKNTNGKCTCSSFDVVNFGCKCGGK